MGCAFVAANFGLGLRQHDHAARGEHDVIVQVLRHGFIERAGFFVDRRRRVLQVVGPDDGRVAPRVAAAKPAFFQDRHIGDPKVFAKVVCCRQSMPASADDDRVIFLFRLRRFGPSAVPPCVVAQCFARDGKCGITFHSGESFRRWQANRWFGCEPLHGNEDTARVILRSIYDMSIRVGNVHVI